MVSAVRKKTELRTISRSALLVAGSDEAFRGLIHDLMAYAHHLDACRDGFGAIIGLSGVQYEIFMIVRRFGIAPEGKSPGISVGEVAARLHRSGAFTTIEASKLVDRGVIEKRTDPADGRKVLLVLTAAGESLARTLAPYQRQVNDVLFDCIDKRRFEALSAMVRDMVDSGDRAVALSEFLVAQLAQGAKKRAA